MKDDHSNAGGGMGLVQIKIGQLLGALMTVIITIVGSAIGIYVNTSNSITSNAKDIAHNKELFETKFELLDDKTDLILSKLDD